MSRPVRIVREPVLVTGGAGYMGSHLVDRIASLGGPVTLLDSLVRRGAETNLAWLRARHPGRIGVAVADVRDRVALARAMESAVTVFHLAAPPVPETPSSALSEEILDGAVSVLETAGRWPRTPGLILVGSHETYGELEGLRLVETDAGYAPADFEIRRRGVDETWPVDPGAAYGRTMGLAERKVIAEARAHGVRAASLRMSTIYGRGRTGDVGRGWVNRFAQAALAGGPVTIRGDGLQVRDLLHVSDAVEACLACARRMSDASGRAFNVGGGPANAVSLRSALSAIAALTGRPVASRFTERPSGAPRYYVADTRLARVTLGLAPPLNWRSGLSDLVRALGSGRVEAPTRATVASRRSNGRPATTSVAGVRERPRAAGQPAADGATR